MTRDRAPFSQHPQGVDYHECPNESHQEVDGLKDALEEPLARHFAPDRTEGLQHLGCPTNAVSHVEDEDPCATKICIRRGESDTHYPV